MDQWHSLATSDPWIRTRTWHLISRPLSGPRVGTQTRNQRNCETNANEKLPWAARAIVMAAHASLPVARVRKVLSLYLESAVAKEEPQKVSGGASPYTAWVGWVRHGFETDIQQWKQGYFINHSVNGCMAKHSLTSCVHVTLYIVHVYYIANFYEKISFLRE